MMLKTLAAAMCVGMAAAAPQVDKVASAFAQFKKDFGRVYEDAAEEAYKLEVFTENLKYIENHNAEAAAGKHTHLAGVGPFADLTNAEFKAGWTSHYERTTPRNEVWLSRLVNSSADSVDWRTEGAVTPVKN